MRRIKTIQGGRKEIEKYTGHKKSILAVAVNTAGTLVASADESGKIIVWNQDLGIRFYRFGARILYVGPSSIRNPGLISWLRGVMDNFPLLRHFYECGRV